MNYSDKFAFMPLRYLMPVIWLYVILSTAAFSYIYIQDELNTGVKEHLEKHMSERFSLVNRNVKNAMKIGMSDVQLIQTQNIFEFTDSPNTIMGYLKQDSSVVLISGKNKSHSLSYFLKLDFPNSKKIMEGVRERLCTQKNDEDIIWAGDDAFYIFRSLSTSCEDKIHFLRFSIVSERDEHVAEMLEVVSFYTIILLAAMLIVGSFSYLIINKRLSKLLDLISGYKQGVSSNEEAMGGRDEISTISKAFFNMAHKMNAVLDDMYTFVSILSPKGEILFVNNTPLEVSNLKFSEVQSKKLSDTYWWEYDTKAKDEIEGLTKRCLEGEIINHETQIKIADEKLIWINFCMHPVYDMNGEIEHLVAEGVDISKQKEAYEGMLRQSRKAQMGEMISVIAHQWRQPLSVITSVTGKVILDVELDMLEGKEVKRCMAKLNDTVSHLMSTMTQFTNFFNPNKVSKETSFSLVVKNSIAIIGSKIESEGIKVVIKIDKEQKMKSFEEELMQVVMDMMKNSADFFKINKISNAQIVLEQFIEDDKICLAIEDNAGGIKDEDIKDLFKPYFSTKPQDGGTGLGLHMSKMIVEDHCNGYIKVEQLESGARFIICLPLS